MDLDQVLCEVVKEYSDVPGRVAEITYTPAEGYFVMASDLLKDVFSNIVGNSIKHSPRDKPLTIKIKVIKVRAQNVDHYAIMIEDNGPGITDDKKAEIFAYFERRERRMNKSGMGLGLVKTLVEDFGGQVWAEDRISGDSTGGVRFVVMLPVAQ